MRDIVFYLEDPFFMTKRLGGILSLKGIRTWRRLHVPSAHLQLNCAVSKDLWHKTCTQTRETNPC